MKCSVQVALLPRRLTFSAFLPASPPPRCYCWCCCLFPKAWVLGPQYSLGIRACFCICSQGPWGLRPQFFFWESGHLCCGCFSRGANQLTFATLHDSYWKLEHFIPYPFLSLNLCAVLISWVGSINCLLCSNMSGQFSPCAQGIFAVF